jgi:hypothetical protein
MNMARTAEQEIVGTRRRTAKALLLPVAGMAAGAALLVWWGVSRKKRARGMSEDRQRARELRRDWKRAAGDR